MAKPHSTTSLHEGVNAPLTKSEEQPAIAALAKFATQRSGIDRRDMHLDAPAGTRKVSVTADLADPQWESKMDEALRDLVTKAMQEKPGQKKPG